MKLILDWDSLVERVRLSIFAPWFLRDHTFCQTRSRFFSLFPPFTLSSLYADGRTKARPLYLSPCLLLSRCVSRGQHHSKNWMVMALTGRPVTKRSHACERSGLSGPPCCQSTP